MTAQEKINYLNYINKKYNIFNISEGDILNIYCFLNIQCPFIDGLLDNCVIHASLKLNIEYLPKGFNPNVKGRIHLPNLKSKILKELLLLPGPKRQLGFNLLRSY